MQDDDVRRRLENLKRGGEALPQFAALGLEITQIDVGSATMRLPYSEELIGNPDSGAMHGGAVTTLMDSVCGLAAYATVKEGQSIATLDLRMDYLRPAAPGQTLFGFAECYRVTSNVAFVRGIAHHGNQSDPIANCVASFMVGSVGFVLDGKAAS